MKHCTARCRGNPSGTFPVPVWGWRGFQTDSGRGAGPKGEDSQASGCSFETLKPAQAALIRSRPGTAPAAFGTRLGTTAAGRAGGCRGRRPLHRRAPRSPDDLCRLWGTRLTVHGPGGVLPTPLRHPTHLPSSLTRHSTQPLAKFRAWGVERIKKQQAFGSVFSQICPPVHFCFLRHFSSQPRAEVSGHFSFKCD